MRRWLQAEVDFVLANRERMKYQTIANRLKRSLRSVEEMLKRRKLATGPRQKITKTELRRVHALGWSDVRIAAHFGMAKSSVQSRRQCLGLPANYRQGQKEHWRQREEASSACY